MKFKGLRLSAIVLGTCISIQSCNSPTPILISNQNSKLSQIVQAQKTKSKFADAFKGLEPKEGDSGLLSGFDTDTSQNRKGYSQFYDFEKPDLSKTETNQTLYLTRIGNKIELTAKLDYIASPQKLGFIYAGQVRYLEKPRIEYCGCIKCTYSKCLIGFDYSKIWVAKSKQEIQTAREEQLSQIENFVDSEFEKSGVNAQDVTDYEKISFISDGFYVVTGFHSKIHGGAAWFNAFTRNFAVPLSDQRIASYLKDLYTPKQIEDAYGAREQRRWSGRMVDVADTSTYTLARKNGKTHILGMIEVDGNSHRSFHKSFNLGFALNKLVVYDNPTVDFDAFKIIYPDIIDLFVSPNRNTIFVLTKTEIIGLDVSNEKEIFKTKHNLSFNKIVMVEWATGDFVSKWQSELR